MTPVRIDRLDIVAFGNFTDTSLDLSSPGLQIIYGANEAGKTTARSAIFNLLYDFDFRTQFDFVHPMARLQLGALIRTDSGAAIEVARFKRNNDPLVARESGKPITDANWHQVLQGMSKADYEAMMTLGWKELLEGTEKLVDRGGALGETLFAAGLGVPEIDAVLKDLENQALALYAPRASTKVINASLKACIDSRKLATSQSLKPTAFAEAEKNHQKTKKLRESLDVELRERQQGKDRLVILRGVLPNLVLRRQIIEERARLLSQGPLPARSWAEQVNEAIEKRRQLELNRASLETQLAQTGERLSKITVDTDLLSIADQIDDLAEKIGAYEEGRNDRNGLSQESRDLERDALGLLSRILRRQATEPDLDQARMVLTSKEAIGPASEEWTASHSKLEQAETALGTRESELGKVRDELALLAQVGDPSPLEDAVNAAVSQGDLDKALSAARSELQTAYDLCVETARRLGMEESRFSAALKNPAPSNEEVEHVLQLLQEADAEERSARQQADASRARAEELKKQLNQLDTEGEFPNEDSLTGLRKMRDETWKLIRSAWLLQEIVTGEGTKFSDDHELASYYEMAMNDSDRTADRMWREADKTALRNSLARDIDREQSTSNGEAQSAQEIRERAQSTYAEWRKAWPELPIPVSHESLRQWMQNLERLRTANSNWERAKAAHHNAFRTLRTHRNRLASLAEKYHIEMISGNDLAPLLERSKGVVGEIKRIRDERAALEKQLRQIEQKVLEAQKALDLARSKERSASEAFRKLLSPYADDVTSPGEGRSLLSQLDALGRSLEKRDSLEERIAGIEARSKSFEAEANNVLSFLGKTTAQSRADVIRRLVQSLKESRLQEAERKTISDEREDAEKRLREVKEGLSGIATLLNALAGEVAVADTERLANLAESSIKLAELEENIANTEQELIEQGGGQPISELDESSKGLDVALLNAKISGLTDSIDSCEKERKEAIRSETELEGVLQKMDGSDSAASAEAIAESELAKGSEAAELYVRLVLARYIATEAIRRYSDKHQDPLLSRASNYLNQLTDGRYKRTAVVEDSKSRPRLSTIDLNGEERSISELSDGTRDQLYFALRLAAIQETVDSGFVLPVVLDDVLVNFDDNRTRSALKSLTNLARSTQVLLLTHHEHMLSLASDALASGEFSVVRLV